MKPVDQTFFSAYGPDAVATPTETNKPKASGTPAGRADRRNRGTAIEKVYSDVTWYRVDDVHSTSSNGNRPPTKPHFTTQPRPVAISAGVDSEASVDRAEALRQLADWQSSCLVIAEPYAMAPVELASATSLATVVTQKPPVAAAPPPAAPPIAEAAAEQIVTAEVETVVPAASVPAWTPVWEVDEFDWPEEFVRLHDSQADYFRYAGEKLRDASHEGLKLLAVVATREKEGCTTVATCLARAAAAVGTRVALVDANLAHPELGPKLGLDFSHGWQESLSGRTPIAEAAVVALATGLTLLPLSAAHRISSLHDAKVAQQLRAIADSFDLVIIDAGVVPPGDVEMFEKGTACPVNAALVVRDLRRTTETETLVTASRLKALGIEAVGIAENFLGRSSQSAAA